MPFVQQECRWWYFRRDCLYEHRQHCATRPWRKRLPSQREVKLRCALRYLSVVTRHQRRTATTDQTASTSPNGQAPCRNPYTDPSTQDPANPNTNQRLRFSSV